MSKKITLDQLKELATYLGVELATLKAVIKVESSGSGFDAKTGKIIIQFEPYWFKIYTNVRVMNGVENQQQEWQAFNIAFSINPKAAMLSTSWGMMQVMGFNHIAAGYKTVDMMLDAFKQSEYNQILGACRFIKSKKTMHMALRRNDWGGFAYYYNGKNFKDFKYDTRLALEYKKANIDLA